MQTALKKMLLLLILNLGLNTNEVKDMAWISGNYYLSQAQMENNASIIWEFFGSRGWTAEAVAGMLGNMQWESTINPGIWEGLSVGTGGYGLVQWTPYTKYANWAGNQWENNGQLEMQRIEYEVGLTGAESQWIATSAYPLTFAQFTQSTQSTDYLTSAFMHNYERPDSYSTESTRQGYARYWYTFINDEPAPPPAPTPEEPTAQDQIPYWLYAAWSSTKWRRNFTVINRFV